MRYVNYTTISRTCQMRMTKFVMPQQVGAWRVYVHTGFPHAVLGFDTLNPRVSIHSTQVEE